MDASGEEPFWLESFEEQLANLPASAYLCQCYETSGEQLRAVVPFCREGIQRRQQCVYFVPPSGVPDFLRSLRASGIHNTKRALERGALVPVTTRDGYIRDGRFSPAAMLAYLRDRPAQAKRDHYAGMRVASQMDWVLQPDVDTDSFLTYEGPLLEEFLATTGTRMLEQFHHSAFRPEIIHGALRTHPLIVLGGHLVDNLYSEPGALVVEDGGGTDGRRVEWMLTQRQEKTRRSLAIADLEQWALRGAAPTDLMKAATHLVALELKANMAESFELQRPESGLRLVAAGDWRVPPIDGTQVWGKPAEVFPERPRPGHPLIISDWSSETRFKRPAVFGPDEISSSVVMAISTPQDEHLYGVLGVHFKQPRTFSADEIALLEKVAAALAYAVSHCWSEEQFRTLVERVPDIIARFDVESRLVSANPALEAIAEAPADSLKGKTMREVGLSEALVASWELVLRRAWRTEREETIDFTLESRSGMRYFQGTIVPQRSPTGGVQSLMVIARDLTEHRRAESERAKLYEDVLVQQARLLEQQARLQELVSRLVEDHAHELQRVGHVIRAEQLTERERQILSLLTVGWTNREIAAQLGLRVGTVKNQVARILEKLDVNDRTQAAVRAVELGLAKTTL